MNAPLQDPRAGTGPADSFYRRAFMLAATALIGLAVYQVVKPFLQPMAWAAILALLLHPLQRRLGRLLRGRESLAALVLTLLVLLMFIGPLTGLAVSFAAQAQDLAQVIPGLVDRFRAYDSGSLASLSFTKP